MSKISIVSNIFNPVGPSAPGGLEVFNYYLASELEKLGEPVTLYASGDSAKLRCLIPLVKKSLQYSKSEKYLANPWNYRKITFEEFAIFTDFIENGYSEGILHFNTDNFLPVYLAIKKNLPILTTLHLAVNNSLCNILQKLLNEDELKKVHFIGVSKKQMQNFKYSFKIIHHGVNLDEFAYSESFRNSYLWLGRFVDQKNCIDAIKAANYAKVKLEIGGKPNNNNELEYYNSQIANLLSGTIIFKGYVTSQKRARFYRGKSTIFCSKAPEAFGLVLIESMACGTPVISYDVGAASEVIIDGKNGFIVKENSPEGIIKAMQKIESMTREQYQSMRRFCRSHIEKYFSLDVMVKNYINTYNEIYQIWEKKYEAKN